MAAEGDLSEYWYVVVADPVTAGTLYAGASTGVLKSVDSGASWSSAGIGLPRTSVHALAIDPITPTTLYAGSGLGVFQSIDGGATWTPLNAGLTVRTGPYPEITALVVDPKAHPVILDSFPGALRCCTAPFLDELLGPLRRPMGDLPPGATVAHLDSRARSTSVWVPMPAWSVPKIHLVRLPRMRASRISVSWTEPLSACPMCSAPVTFGSGMAIE